MFLLAQGHSKVVAAFGRKPLNFRIPSGLAATLEQPCSWPEIGNLRVDDSTELAEV